MSTREAERLKPPPGHPDAVKSGCTCPILDNHYGKGYNGKEVLYWQNEDCPLHSNHTDPESQE